MVTSRQQRALPASPALGRWLIGMLTAALFAFHVNYVRIHLLTELHHGDSTTASGHAADHHDDHQDGNDHEHDQHKPHSASEHQLQLAGKQKRDTPPQRDCSPPSNRRAESRRPMPRC